MGGGGWGWGLQTHKHWEHLQGFSQKKKVKIAVFLHLIRTPEVSSYGLHPRLSQKFSVRASAIFNFAFCVAIVKKIAKSNTRE